MIFRGPFQPVPLYDSVIFWLYLFSLEVAFSVYFEEFEDKIFCPSVGVTWSLGSLQHHAPCSPDVLHLLVTHLLGWLA